MTLKQYIQHTGRMKRRQERRERLRTLASFLIVTAALILSGLQI